MVNFKKGIFFFIPLFVLLLLHASPANKRCFIMLTSAENNKVSLNVEFADTPAEREKGLMFRKFMKDSEGMLFVFEYERQLNFWMKNTYIPLDIAYISRDGIINEIYCMKPLDVSIIYNSIKPAMYALEVNSGWFKKHNIKPGSKIELNGCICKQDNHIKR